MDTNEWNVFSQLLIQAGNAKKEANFGPSEDQHYQNVPIRLDARSSAIDVSEHYGMQLSGDNATDMQIRGLSYSTTDGNMLLPDKSSVRLGSRQASNNSVNGASRPSVESNVMKSLLTGQRYVEPSRSSLLNTSDFSLVDSGPNRSAALLQSSVNFGFVESQQDQQSLLTLVQPSFQQNETNASGLVGKMEETITPILGSEAIPTNIAPGEKVYVFVDGVTYEIVAGSNQELMAQPATESSVHLATGMSLEDLANVSAEQESLKLTDVAVSGLAETDANMIHQAQLGLELLQGLALQDGSQPVNDLHYLHLQQQQSLAGTAVETAGQEGMQLILMTGDGDARLTGATNGKTSDAVKLSLHDYMQQTGQSLPAELQELVGRGIDLSNCEFVIQDEDESQHNVEVFLSSGEGSQPHSSISANLQQQLSSVMSTSHLFTDQLNNSQTQFGESVAVMDMGSGVGVLRDNLSSVSSSNVLALLASTAVADQEQQQTVALDSAYLPNHVPPMPLIAPVDEDDGEFAYLTFDQQETSDKKLSLGTNPCDAFLKAYLGFIQGNKPETLSSVANSAITKRPPLPLYDPDLCRRPVRTIAQQHQIANQTREPYLLSGGQKILPRAAPVSMSLVYTDPTGTSLVSVAGNNLGSENSGQISVTPFIVQNIDGKSVVVPNLELQKYLSLKQDKSCQPLTVNIHNKQLSGRKTKEPFCRIITRKLRGSDDDDSFEESDSEYAAISCMSDSDSDPAWKPAYEDSWLKKYGQQPVEVAKPARGRRSIRGKPRTTGRCVTQAASVAGTVNSEGSSASVGYILQVGPENNSSGLLASSSAAVNPSDAHNYQKGDFVVERKDLYSHGEFPVWKIEAGRLLQKYEPFKSDIGILHKSASIYSSWPGDIRSSYKAVVVDTINTLSGRSETVRLSSEYVPLPPDDSLEQDALMELFNIYIQDILSQALDPLFLSTVMEQQEDYYLGPLRQIDGLLIEAQQAIRTKISWTSKFNTALDRSPYFQLMNVSPQMPEDQRCEATVESSCPVVRSVKFYGPVYNSDLLQVTEEVKKANAETFYIGQNAADYLPVYHALCHFKFLLFKKCEEEVQYLRLKNDKTDEVVLGECLQNRIFVQQCLRELKQLLQKCSIVITVVTKAKEEEEEEEQMVTQ